MSGIELFFISEEKDREWEVVLGGGLDGIKVVELNETKAIGLINWKRNQTTDVYWY